MGVGSWRTLGFSVAITGAPTSRDRRAKWSAPVTPSRDRTGAETVVALASSLADRGTHFRRQVPIGPYVTDFCCLKARLIVRSTAINMASMTNRCKGCEANVLSCLAGVFGPPFFKSRSDDRTNRFWRRSTRRSRDPRPQPLPARGRGAQRSARLDGHLYRQAARLDRAACDGHRRGISLPASCIFRPAIRPQSSRATTRPASRLPGSADSWFDDALPVQFFRWVIAVLHGRSRHLDLFRRARRQADQPAHRADALVRAHHADRLRWRSRSPSACSPHGRLAPGSTAADGRLGDWLLGPGVCRRLHADLRLLHQSALAPGAGLFADRAGLWAMDRAAYCPRSRLGLLTSR